MVFGRKKKGSKEKQSKPPKKKSKGGGKMLKAIGLEAERAPEEKEVEKADRQAKIILAWKYLRERIDRGVADYLETGSEAILREHVQRPALDTLLEHLRRMKEEGVVWSQPDRQMRSSPEIEVVSEKLNSRGLPTSFVVRESFLDYSLLRSAQGERRAEGRRRVLQATVEVEDGQIFQLASVLEVKGVSAL